MGDLNSTKSILQVGSINYTFYSLQKAKEFGLDNIDQLPISLKILMENLLRKQDATTVTWEDCLALNNWAKTAHSSHEINFYPARVILQDYTGVPVVVDLAALREGMAKLGGDPQKINPLVPVDLVIDHSLIVEHYGNKDAYDKNIKIEFERNNERYQFLKWGQKSFNNFRVIPPGTGIIHQVNLEYLAKVVWVNQEGSEPLIYPDTCVGTDSHTTMINGLSVLGWGVGGIEAEAAMLGQPANMIIPDVVGFKLKGELSEGVTSTDLVLTVTQMLRKHGVVEKFVEFFGPSIAELSLADRATLANMAPEYGATCGFFPIDHKTIDYLRYTGRDEHQIQLVEAYAKAQGLWANPNKEPKFTSIIELDLNSIVPCISGPKRPQDRINLKDAAFNFKKELISTFGVPELEANKEVQVEGQDYKLHHGDICVASITSCTNTSNPSVLIAAGLLAKKANEFGLKSKSWVKTSLSPGSKIVTDYLIEADLQHHLDALGFYLTGYGCATCAGNSGPLNPEISKAITKNSLIATTVLSGNRNFEGRVIPEARANYLMSPPLVVAYAIAGNITIDITRDPLGKDKNGKNIYLKDIYPSNKEIEHVLHTKLNSKMYIKRYQNVFEGDPLWQNIRTSDELLYSWDPESTYIANPPFFNNINDPIRNDFTVKNANILLMLGDSITTDHISPAGNIKENSPAGKYLKQKGITPFDFNSYGARRGNHEVMMRGTFANIRLKNEIMGGEEGGNTKFFPTGEKMSIFDASIKYQFAKIPLVVIAGKEYGSGSSRDWAAKGAYLLGIKAIVAESFERIHRANLVRMGVMPLEFPPGKNRYDFKLNGTEKISLSTEEELKPKMNYTMTIKRDDGLYENVNLLCRIDTFDELNFFKSGGILQSVLRKIALETNSSDL